MQASLVVRKKSRQKFSWRHMRFDCCSYPPVLSRCGLAGGVGVAQRIEAFGNLLRIPPQPPLPIPPALDVAVDKPTTLAQVFGRELAGAGSVRTTP
jgi:hypothetical protein